LLSALLLQVFYGIRSERQLMEQLDYNLLYRWFVGLSPDDPVWDPTTFTKNRERLQNGDVFTKFMTRLLSHSQVKPLLSDEHFLVDGTLIDAWASQRSFRPKDGSGDDNAPTSAARSARTTPMRVPAWAGGGRQGYARQWHRRTPGFGDHAEGETQSRRPPHHGR
jgi:hypothetical protein